MKRMVAHMVTADADSFTVLH